MSSDYPATPTTTTTKHAYPPDAHAQAQAHANDPNQPMDARQGEYAQPGLHSPYSRPESGQTSEAESVDQASAAQYSQGQDVKFNPSATPTSEYGMTPQSARSGHFQEYAHRPQYPDQRYQASAGQHPNMAHPQSPSQSLTDGSPVNHHHSTGHISNTHVPVDPSIAASSPTYPPQPPHYPQYPHQEHMGHYQHPGPPMYPRPGEYPPHYGPPYAGHYGPPPMMGRPQHPGGGVPLSTVYSFVPIPGTHQQKRPRRRYEEIERMYKCGWQGCEKAYGTLNHLNAHVTMQSHGVKRTPEEFKEIRKEWKLRKKEEDSHRKHDDDNGRPGGSQGGGPSEGQPGSDSAQSAAGYSQSGGRQLPPLGYAPAGGQPVQPQPYPPGDAGMQPYPPQAYYQQGPGSPYAAQQGPMYSQTQPPPASGQEQNAPEPA